MNAGLTLVELAVVMVVLGMAMALVGPRLGRSRLERASAAAAAHRIAALAVHARSRAATERREVCLCLHIGEGLYWLGAEEQPDQPLAVLNAAARRWRLPEGVAFTAIQVRDSAAKGGETARLTFRPEGWADCGRISIADRSGGIWQVLVRPLTGRVEVHAGQEEGHGTAQ